MSARGTEILLVPAGSNFTFPEVEIPRFERVAENLRAAMRTDWHHEVVCLCALPLGPEGVPRYFVAEALRQEAPVSVGVWVQATSLQPDSFRERADYQALCLGLAACGRENANSSEGPFAKLGWFEEVNAWVATGIESSGLRLSGPFRQLNASPTFSLIRFETDGPAVWFKAVGEPNLREFSVTRELGWLFPAFVPRILSVREDWNAWLALEAEGTHPGENTEIGTWTTMGRALAELQLASRGQTLHLVAAGCCDLRLESLLELADEFFETTARRCMDEQTTLTPARLTRRELSDLSSSVKSALRSLRDIGIPETLGHSDVNPGNILVSRDRCVFTDWAEAHVGHPFFSFEYLRRVRRRFHADSFTEESGLMSAYFEAWRSAIRVDHAYEAFRWTPLVAAYAYAVHATTWRDTKQMQAPNTAPWLRSLTRTMHHEANRLHERTSV